MFDCTITLLCRSRFPKNYEPSIHNTLHKQTNTMNTLLTAYVLIIILLFMTWHAISACKANLYFCYWHYNISMLCSETHTHTEIPKMYVRCTTHNLRDMARVFAFKLQMGGLHSVSLRHLATIQPTSVESECAFSVCGQFITKIGSVDADNSVDALCLLKTHPNNNK